MTYYMVETLNGNYILKTEEKMKEDDFHYVEMEFYCETLEEAKKEFKLHLKGMIKD